MLYIPELHYIPIAIAWYLGLIASHYYSSELIWCIPKTIKLCASKPSSVHSKIINAAIQ